MCVCGGGEPVKYEACRDVCNDAERVFHRLGVVVVVGGELEKGGKWRRELVGGRTAISTLWRQDRGTQHLQKNKYSTLKESNTAQQSLHLCFCISVFACVHMCVCVCVCSRQDKTENEGSPAVLSDSQ